MIHLDANLLIALVKQNDAHHPLAARAITGSGPFGCSSVAWMEFRSKPVHPHDQAALEAILAGGIVPFDEATAALAGAIFHLTGAHRRTRLDTMIAATAIHAGAALAKRSKRRTRRQPVSDGHRPPLHAIIHDPPLPMPEQPTCLILTVGTGTQGQYSNLAQGLTNTIKISRPVRFWLVPSTRPTPSRWRS
ncbi:MAG: PIN domain-containing protein [Verrucomicrobia bacterium]|nr:PIN domain-containing protein [Verrucomicrobiota bacterium]